MLLLNTKINRPQLQQSRLLKRPNLLNQLLKDANNRLTFIQAAAGYGKTTIMVQLSEQLQSNNLNVGWLTLDDDDNDPIRLYQYLHAVLTQTSELQPITDDKITKNHIHQLLSQLDTASEYTLFIDEMEVLKNTDSLNLMWWLYSFLPINYHLVIASRKSINWSLAKDQLQGLVKIIRVNELKLSSSDANELQNYLQLSFSQNTNLTPYMMANQSLSKTTATDTNLIDDKLVASLIEKTEGWLTGIQLINLYCKNESNLYQLVNQISGAQHQIAEFLAEQVFLQCNENVQDFLMSISVLRKISVKLCQILTEVEDTQSLLKNLSQQGLFIQAIDDEYQWFRIHQLMRQFLQTRLKNTNEKKYWLVHDKAAKWYQEENLLLEAIYHGQIMNNDELVLSSLAKVSHDLILEGRIYSLLELTESLSDAQLYKQPALLYDLIWGLILSHRHQKAERYIQMLEQKNLSSLEADNIISTEYKDKQLGLSAMAAFSADDLSKAYKLAQIGLEQLTPEAYFFRAPLVGICALHQFFQGLIAESSSLLRQSRMLYIRGGNPYGLAYVDSIAATFDRLLGDISSSKRNFGQIGLSPEYSKLGTNDNNREMMLNVASSLKANLYYELNRIEEASQVLIDFEQGDNTAIVDMIIIGFLTKLRLESLKGNSLKPYIAKANSKAQEWEIPRLALSVQQWQQQKELHSLIPVALKKEQGAISNEDIHVDNIRNNVEPYIFYSDSDLSAYRADALSLTNLLTGLDLLPYRQAIFFGDSKKIQQSIDILSQQLKLNRPFVTHNARIQMLLAMAYYVLGQLAPAYNSLVHALEQIRSTGSHRFVLDEHPLLFAILKELNSASKIEVVLSTDMQDYIRNLLKVIESSNFNEAYAVNDQKTDKGLLLTEASQVNENKENQSNDQRADNNIDKEIVLSPREIEILLLVEQGSSDGQIADSIFLSIHTVKWHLRNIYHKLQVRSRTQAVAEARQQHILD